MKKEISTTWFASWQGIGDIRRGAVASFGAGAARLVNRDGDDLQGCHPTRPSAITHGLHDVIGRVDRVCCLDVDGLEDEYVSEQNRILYLAETPI